MYKNMHIMRVSCDPDGLKNWNSYATASSLGHFEGPAKNEKVDNTVTRYNVVLRSQSCCRSKNGLTCMNWLPQRHIEGDVQRADLKMEERELYMAGRARRTRLRTRHENLGSGTSTSSTSTTYSFITLTTRLPSFFTTPQSS